ncbi:MAG: substrate-binding domain-containing protein [Verrucomicrobiales bacterium]
MKIPLKRRPIAPQVAVLVDTSTSWGRGIIEGVHQYQSQNKEWRLFVEPRGMDQRRWLPAGWKGDGVIARVGFPELVGQLQELRIPVVNVSGIRLPGCDFPRIHSNLAEAARMAAEHLFSSGFKNFAYFSLSGLDYVDEHKEAFRKVLEKTGHTCALYEAKPQLGGAEPEWTTDLDRLAAWLKALPKPVAIFTWNTSAAREVIFGCFRGGLKVPEEVSVMSGSDDDLFCKVAPVPISAVKNAAEEIGFHAAGCLDQMMNRPQARKPKDMRFSPLGIVVRQSTETLAIDDPALVRALRHIREDPAREMSVGEVAKQSGLCRRTLEQRFAKTLGRSPAAEIRRVRIELAIHLLQSSRLSVSTIAEKSGFTTAEYMATIFRKHLGVAPLSLRRPAKSDEN